MAEKASLWRMVVEGWLHRAARTRPRIDAPSRAPTASRSYAELHAAARAGARRFGRGVGRGDRVAIALPPGLPFAEALHACLLLGAVAVPVDLRLADAERAHICDGAALVVSETLSASRSTPGRTSRTTRLERHRPRPRRRRRRHPHLRHDLRAAPDRAHLRQLPVERARLGRRAGLATPTSAGCARCRSPTSAACRSSCAAPIYATTAVVHARFDTDLVLHALREQDVTLVSLVATTLARLLDAGLEHPPALRCALTGGGPVPDALIERARDAGVPVSSTYGLTEACSQVTTARRRRCSARA